MRLNDKVSIITGAGRGIGEATALKFAAEGSKVVVVDLNEEGSQGTKAKIQEVGGEAIKVTVDVTKRTEVERLLDEVISH